MRKILVGLALALGLLAAPSGSQATAITAAQQYQLNHLGGKGWWYQNKFGDMLVDLGNGVTLASGKIFVGNSSNVSTPVTPTGDVTISNAGVTAIGAGKVLQSMLVTPDVVGNNVERLFHTVYDFAVNGGAISAIPLSGAIPAKSIITQAFFFVKTQLAGAAGTTIALSCDAANDIFSAADETGVAANSIVAGVETGTAATMHFSSAGCTPTITIGTHVLTAGKLDIYLRYTVAE